MSVLITNYVAAAATVFKVHDVYTVVGFTLAVVDDIPAQETHPPTLAGASALNVN